jgi:hypothetical protein
MTAPDLTPDELSDLWSQPVAPTTEQVLRLVAAARERDELRAQVAEMRAEDELWVANAPDLRAYAVKVEAERDEMRRHRDIAMAESEQDEEAMVKMRAERDVARRLVQTVLAVHDACASTGSGVYEMHPDWVRDARAVLAQKEPKP